MAGKSGKRKNLSKLENRRWVSSEKPSKSNKVTKTTNGDYVEEKTKYSAYVNDESYVDGNFSETPPVAVTTRTNTKRLRAATATVAEELPWESFDFQNGAGISKARRHRNPDGSIGGWIGGEAVVAPTATLGPNVWVYENATVWDNAIIDGSAQIRGSALIYENAIVSGRVLVEDEANVYGNARVMDDAHLMEGCAIFGNAVVDGSCLIGGHTYVLGKAHITDEVMVLGSCTIRANSYLKGRVRLAGELDLNGDIQMGGEFELFGKCLFVGSHIIVREPASEMLESGIFGYSRDHLVVKAVAERLFDL